MTAVPSQSPPKIAPPRTAPVTGFWLLPAGLRNFVRSRETGLVLVSIVVGLLSGLLVGLIGTLSEFAHALLFDIPYDAHLSATGVISWQRTLLVPISGGVVLAVIGWITAGKLKGEVSEAIQGNALFGGRGSVSGTPLCLLPSPLS